ncbi:MAG: FeoA family protein [Candidatus Omnitrophica bacterium]|nr:FeoA family protein [Candidatus Omnitrophota bacterium]
MQIDLTQMQPGETGVIVDVHGGHGFIRKIQSMDLRPGKRVTKVSSHFWRGTQTVEVDNLQVAIGFGMSKKILIEIERSKSE